MKLIHRFGYYFSGFAMGLVFLFFFLSGKKTSCDYGPNSRVLKHLRKKPHRFEPAALQFFKKNKLDTAQASEILESGYINFSRSDVSLDSCKIYKIHDKKESIELTFQNCDSLAKITHATFFKKD